MDHLRLEYLNNYICPRHEYYFSVDREIKIERKISEIQYFVFIRKKEYVYVI